MIKSFCDCFFILQFAFLQPTGKCFSPLSETRGIIPNGKTLHKGACFNKVALNTWTNILFFFIIRRDCSKQEYAQIYSVMDKQRPQLPRLRYHSKHQSLEDTPFLMPLRLLLFYS